MPRLRHAAVPAHLPVQLWPRCAALRRAFCSLSAVMAEINVLVLDNGSDTVKAGYCIPERDPLLVRSLRLLRSAALSGAPQPSRLTHSNATTTPQVTPTAVRLASGDAVPSDGGVLRPIRRGVVQDWEALESIYHHIFYEQARPAARHPRPRPLTANPRNAAGVGHGRGGVCARRRAAADAQGAWLSALPKRARRRAALRACRALHRRLARRSHSCCLSSSTWRAFTCRRRPSCRSTPPASSRAPPWTSARRRSVRRRDAPLFGFPSRGVSRARRRHLPGV